MRDTLLEARIRYRLQDFLLERGYTLAPADTADLYVLATFGAGERIVASTAPIFRAAETRVVSSRDGTATRRTFIPERMEYLRVPLLKNSIWLQVLTSDAKHFRASHQVKNLWRGEAAMVARAETLPSNAAYLLAPSLKFFGKGTQDIVTMDIYPRDAAWK